MGGGGGASCSVAEEEVGIITGIRYYGINKQGSRAENKKLKC